MFIMNTEIPDDIDVVRKLKCLKDMTSTFRKKLEDCIIEKNLYFKTSQEAHENVQYDSLISEDYSTNKDQSIRTASSLSRICNKALEKNTLQNKEHNVYEKIYSISSPPNLNSEYCNRNEGPTHIKNRQQEPLKEKLKTIFSQQLENFAHTSANVNSFIAKDHAVLNENFKNENSFMDSTLLKDLNRTDIAKNSSENFDYEELEPDKLIMVEIYRRISNFFEIGIVTPFSMIIENHFEVFKFGLAIIWCMVYTFFTNANKKLRTKFNSKTKGKDSYANSVSPALVCEFPSITSCPPVKTSDSMESLIILKSNNNSKEELNISCETEHNKNVNGNNSVKQTLKNSNNPKYENGPNNNCKLNRCEEKMPKLENLDSILLEKFQLHSNYCHAEIEGVAVENKAYESIDKNYGNLEEKATAANNFTEIGGLDLKNEHEESKHVFNKKAVIPESPTKEDFSSTISLRDTNTMLKEIESIDFGSQSESFYLLSPINEDEENVARTEKHFNISDISQLSNSFSAEPRLLDIDEKLFQHITQSNAENVGIKQEIREKHPILIDSLEQDIFSEKYEVKYESMDTTPLLNNNLAAKTVDRYGKGFLYSRRSCIGDNSGLGLCDQPRENNFETIPEGNKKTLELENFFNEFENKNEENTLCKLIGDSSICGAQNNNKVISLINETSSELSSDTFDFNNIAYATEENKTLNESTEVPMLIKEPKITACTANNFEDNNFENIISKNKDLRNIIITCESNNSSQQSRKDDYSKCNELPIENYIECTAIEVVSNENLTGEEIDFSEYDLVEECETTATTYAHIIECVPDEVEYLNFTQNPTKNLSKLNDMAKLKNGEKINGSYPIRIIKHLENENCNKNNTQNKMHQTLKYSQEFSDTFKVSSEENSPFHCIKYKESSKETIEQHSYDIVIEGRSFDMIKIPQEKSVGLHQVFSSSMPDVRDIDVDQLISCKMNASLNYPNTFLPSDMGSSAQELLEPSCSHTLSPSVEEKGIKGCFQNLPRIRLPYFKQNSKECSNEDLQCLPSNASEPFEIEAPLPSSSSKNAIAVFEFKVKADRKKNGKQKSFRSKVSSLFNGVRTLPGRMLMAAEEIGNYKKQKNDSFD